MFTAKSKNLFTETTEDVLLSLPKEQVLEYIKQLQYRLNNTNVDVLEQCLFIDSLTKIVDKAIKIKETDIIKASCASFLTIAEKYSRTFIAHLKQTISAGKHAGLTPLHVLMDNFYFASFNPNNYCYIVGMNLIFSVLQAHPHFKALFESFGHVISEGSEKGKNALWLFSQALLQASMKPFSGESTLFIGECFQRVIQSLDPKIHLLMVERFSEGPYRGKSSVYLLVCALKEAARTNMGLTKILCDLLIQLNISYPRALLETLASPIDLGPYKGMNPLHIVLIALISAAYIDNNQYVIDNFLSFLQVFVHTSDKESLQSAFQVPITHGLNAYKTGLDLLKTAQEKGTLSNIKMDALHALILDLEPESRTCPLDPVLGGPGLN